MKFIQNERLKLWKKKLPAFVKPSDKPPHPAKISKVAKMFFEVKPSLVSVISTSSFSPSLDFPFLFLIAASLAGVSLGGLSLMLTGSCRKWKLDYIL